MNIEIDTKPKRGGNRIVFEPFRQAHVHYHEDIPITIPGKPHGFPIFRK